MMEGGYDQLGAAKEVITRLRSALLDAKPGSVDATLGISVPSGLDRDAVALWVHSRSGLPSERLAKDWAATGPGVSAIVAYGPTYETGEGGFTPAPPDTPYLAISGDADGDVALTASQYLAQHLGQQRTQPAVVSIVKGLGHNFVNRGLSSTKTDDRTSCDAGCPSAAEHERMVGDLTESWLTQFVSGKAGPWTASGTAVLPTTTAGQPARLTAVTNSRLVSMVAGSAPEKAAATVAGDGSTLLCAFATPGEERAAKLPPCAANGLGDFAAYATELRRVGWRTTGGVTFAVPAEAASATHLTLQVGPAADLPVGQPGTPLRVTLTSGTASQTLDVPADDPAVANRATASSNGQYVVGTIRLDLRRVPGFTPGKLSSVTVGGTGKAGAVNLRTIDLAVEGPTATPTAAAPSAATPSGTPAPAPGTDSGVSPAVLWGAGLALLGAVALAWVLIRRRR